MHLDWRTRHKLKKIVHGVLIFAVLVSLVAPQATAMTHRRKQEAIHNKVEELFVGENDYSLNDPRAQLLITILKLLPESHWKPLRKVTIDHKVRTPRGLKDRDTIALNYAQIDSDEEFVAVFLHEIGHVVDLDVMVGESDENSEFVYLDGSPIPMDDPSINYYDISWLNTYTPRTAIMECVSEYAATNPFEDFSEGYIFYLLHGSSFKKQTDESKDLEQKYSFIRHEAFEGQEFSFGDLFYDNEEIYDATVLFYDLNAFIAMMEEEKSKKQTVSRMSSTKPPRYSKI